MFRDGAERLLVFGVGAERFGIMLSAVDEVIDAPAVRPMPDAARTVLGIATIRGSLVTIHDPRPLLNVMGEVRERGTIDDAALLFTHDGRRLGLAVHALHDTILVERHELRSAPGGGSDGTDKSLLGVVRRGSDLIAVLDVEALLDAVAAAADTRT